MYTGTSINLTHSVIFYHSILARSLPAICLQSLALMMKRSLECSMSMKSTEEIPTKFNKLTGKTFHNKQK